MRLPGRAIAMTLALHNGWTDAGASVSLTLRDGVIADLHPDPAAPGIDLGGRLLLPGLVDAHVHLDKTLLGGDWLAFRGGDTVTSRVANEKRLRRDLPWDIATRGDALLRQASAFGTTALRTHVDVDDVTGLRNLHAVLALRERWADRMTIQIVAFPQSGILHCPGTAELMHEALNQGADIVGGLDPIGFDGDLDGHLDVVFGLAERHGKPVDIHLHDGGQAGLRELQAIAQRTLALGMQGRVMVSHAFALGDATPDEFTIPAGRLAQAAVAILTSIPGNRAFPPLERLADAGVTVCLGSDNIRDTWSPMTVISMFERAMLAAYRSGFRSDPQLRACLALATQGGARALGLGVPGLHPGDPADLIAVDAANIPAAVVGRPTPVLVVRAGRTVLDRTPPTEGPRA
jgi:cytosine deaminase